MTLFDYFKTIDLHEIERFVSDGQEENLNLEFKTVNHPNYTDKNREFDKKNLSSALSGFANSAGGIVIWGVKAEKNAHGLDVASKTVPIGELTRFLNFLNRMEGQVVIPLISGIIHEKIEKDSDSGYIKSYIPASDIAPHMALMDGKHYYKRSGDSFYQCEHYDIMDMIARRRSPDLEILTKVLPRNQAGFDKYRYEVLVSIRNNGKSIAKFPYLAINCNHHYSKYKYGLDGNEKCGLNKVMNNTSYKYNYSGGADIVIYPGSVLDVDKFVTEIAQNECPEDFKYTYLLAAEQMENKSGEGRITAEMFLNTGN